MAPLKRRRPVRSQSPQRMALRDLRKLVVEQVHDRDRVCQAEHLVRDVTCGGPLDVHEIIPRSAWVDGTYSTTNCVLVCRNHHRWIDANPDAAHAAGLHGYSWQVPPDPECGHDSMIGVDTAPCTPEKVWRCCSCDWTCRSIPTSRPGMVRLVPATP